MFGSKPARREFEPVPVLPFKGGQSVRLTILSRCLEGVYVHFEGKSLLCPIQDCPLCELGRSHRWYGYLTVGLGGSKWLLRLTSSADVMCLATGDLFGEVLDVNCRGIRKPLRVRRVGSVKCKPESAVSRLEQLRTLWALFQLGRLPNCTGVDEFILMAQASAREQLCSYRALIDV